MTSKYKQKKDSVHAIAANRSNPPNVLINGGTYESIAK